MDTHLARYRQRNQFQNDWLHVSLCCRHPASRHRFTRKQLQLHQSRKPLFGVLQVIYATILGLQVCESEVEAGEDLEPPDMRRQWGAVAADAGIYQSFIYVSVKLSLRLVYANKIQNLYD